MARRTTAATSRAPPLSLTPADARALLDYDRAVFDRYVRRIARLPWREAVRDRGTGHGSYFGTLVHILHVHEAWLVYVVPGRSRREIAARFREPDRSPRTWAEFRTYAERVWSGARRTVGGLTPRSIGRPVRAPWMPGRYTVRDAIVQTTLEEAHHLGELIGALWQRDTPPPAMTWIDVRRSPTPRRAR
jgi:uncharacterized damage-inducible protein DinB